jgi:hypothetical protein
MAGSTGLPFAERAPAPVTLAMDDEIFSKQAADPTHGP